MTFGVLSAVAGIGNMIARASANDSQDPAALLNVLFGWALIWLGCRRWHRWRLPLGIVCAVVGGLSLMAAPGVFALARQTGRARDRAVAEGILWAGLLGICAGLILLAVYKARLDRDAGKGIDPGLVDRRRSPTDSAMNLPSTAAATPTQVNMSVTEELAKLSQLRDRGILSATEFAAAKSKLLHTEIPPGAVSSERAAEIRNQLKHWNHLSLALGIPGVFLQAMGYSDNQPAVTLLGAAILIGGLAFYARMRARSPALGFLGLLSCLGIFFLWLLDKNCLNCAKTNSRSRTMCERCGAPLAP